MNGYYSEWDRREQKKEDLRVTGYSLAGIFVFFSIAYWLLINYGDSWEVKTKLYLSELFMFLTFTAGGICLFVACLGVFALWYRMREDRERRREEK